MIDDDTLPPLSPSSEPGDGPSQVRPSDGVPDQISAVNRLRVASACEDSCAKLAPQFAGRPCVIEVRVGEEDA